MKVSREGIAWSEYRWGHLLLALPVALAIDLYWLLVGLTTRKPAPKGSEKIPYNAILVLFHTEWPLYPITALMWHRMMPRFCWVGLHHFLSYFGSITTYVLGAKCFRFHRNSAVKPMEQIISFLNQNPELAFAIRTDSGGPYEQVRQSIVTLATRTGRPVVCARQFSNRAFRLPNRHWVPLPFGTVQTKISRIFSAHELAELSPAAARERLQFAIEALAISPATQAQRNPNLG